MGSHYSHVTYHPPIYGSGHPSLIDRIGKEIVHVMSQLADLLNPVRVCRRIGHHVPGHDVFAYDAWDLDERYPGYYVGHACGRCGTVVAV